MPSVIVIDVSMLASMASEIISFGAGALLVVLAIYAIPLARDVLTAVLGSGGGGDPVLGGLTDADYEREMFRAQGDAAKEAEINRRYGRPY